MIVSGVRMINIVGTNIIKGLLFGEYQGKLTEETRTNEKLDGKREGASIDR